MPPNVVCSFCERPGHLEATCYALARAKERPERWLRPLDQEGAYTPPTHVETMAASSVAPTTVSLPESPSDLLWNCDTGATAHMTPHRHWIRNWAPLAIPIHLANNQVVYSTGVGDVLFHPSAHRPVTFTRVLHVPDLRSNLLSVLHLTSERSIEVTINKQGFLFRKKRDLLFTASLKGKAAFLDGHTIPDLHSALSATLDRPLLHRRLAHIGSDRLERLLRDGLATGITLTSQTPLPSICTPCISGKQHRDPFPPQATHRAIGVLDRVHCDLHGPINVTTFSGKRYWVSFIDDYSRFEWVAPLDAKSDALAAFKVFKAQAELQTGRRIKIFRDDKGGEFMSKDFESLLQASGITREHTVRATPQQNGVAERRNRTHDEGIVSMLQEAHLPKQFWGEALALHVRILNATPTSALSGVTPFEAVFKHKPDLSMLRVFGCRAFVHTGRDKRKSLDSHTTECIYLGFEEGYKGFKCWNPATKKLVISRDVIFDESSFPGLIMPSSGQDIAIMVDDPPEPPRRPIRSPERPYAAPVPPRAPAPPFVPPWPPLPDSPPVVHARLPEPPVRPPSPLVPPRAAPAPRVPPAVPRRPLRAFGSEPPEAGPSHPYLRPNPPPRDLEWYKVKPKPLPLPPAPRAPSPSPSPPPAPPAPPIAPLPPPAPHVPIVLLQPSDNESSSESESESSSGSGSDSEYQEEAENARVASALISSGLDFLCGEAGYLTESEAWECAYKAVASTTAPRTLAEAMRTPESEQWLQAARNEMQAHMDNGTWELVDLPPGKRAMGCRWIFKVKKLADGTFERHKARVVAKGYSQRPGLDFDETFAPTTKWASLRAVLAIAAAEDLELESVDISTAYLNGVLAPEHEVYMQQPEGFVEGGTGRACRLRKGLYGLKQGGRLWYQKLHSVLTDLGFKRIQSDASVYVWELHGHKIIMPVFVDDITIACKSKSAIQHVKDALARHFTLRDLGPISSLLGVDITRDRPNRVLQLSQRQYVIDILERFNMAECKPVSTPMEPGIRLSQSMAPSTPDEVAFMATVPYASAVGALMYLSVATRPDIAYAVGVLCRFTSNPGEPHWKACKHLLRYLQGTKDLKLTFAPSSSPTSDLFTVYSDADHGANPDNGKSTTGYVVKMGFGAINWSSKLQSIVALSTTEAEYVAAVSAGSDAIWTRHFLSELGYDSLSTPSPLRVDNQSAIAVARNPEHHGRMKQLDLRHFWLRDYVALGVLRVDYIPTEQQAADSLTKALARIKVVQHWALLGLRL